MKYLSVCSGIECASVAWHPLGWCPVAFSEVEAFQNAVLDYHYPGVPNWGDMTRYKDWPDANFDVLVGGTPCQSYSIAGLRKGLADPRGNLMLTYLAIAARYRPRWLVWENVPGVLSSNEGRDFATFLEGLVRIGYGWAYRVFDAQYFGLAQRRRRVFVVGHLGDWRGAAAVLFDGSSMQGNPAPSRSARQSVAGTVTRSALGSGSPCGGDGREGLMVTQELVSTIDASFGRLQGASGQDLNHGHSHLVAFGGNDTRGPRDTATAVRAHGSPHQDFESETFLVAKIPELSPTLGRGSGGRAPGLDADGASDGLIVFDPAQVTNPTNRSNPQPGDPCHTLTDQGQAPTVAFDCKASGTRGMAVDEERSPTLRAMTAKNGNQNSSGQVAVMSGMTVRRLTPLECERLQGLPDNYTLIPVGRKKVPAKDGHRYKAIGNGMAVKCMRWLGERIELVESVMEELKRA